MELRIKDVCREKGITQKELAGLLGVSEMTLSRASKGNTSLDLLDRMAVALGVSVPELFAPLPEHRRSICRFSPLNRRTRSPARIAANLSKWRKGNKDYARSPSIY